MIIFGRLCYLWSRLCEKAHFQTEAVNAAHMPRLCIVNGDLYFPILAAYDGGHMSNSCHTASTSWSLRRGRSLLTSLLLCLRCPWHGDVRLDGRTVTTVQSDALKMQNRGVSPHFIHTRRSLSASWRTLQTCFSRCPSAPGASSRSAWRPSSCPPARGTP